MVLDFDFDFCPGMGTSFDEFAWESGSGDYDPDRLARMPQV